MFDTSALTIQGLCTNLSKRIYRKTKCPTYIEKKKKLYWLILFREKRTDVENQLCAISDRCKGFFQHGGNHTKHRPIRDRIADQILAA